LAELYVETRDTNFVYNQARCFEQNARPVDAINRFREYLRVAKDITPAVKADVDKHIVDCRAVQAEQEHEKEKKAAAAATREQPEAVAPSVPAATGANVAPGVTPGALDLTTKPEAAESRPTPIFKTWWFWTGAAVVVVGAATAILLATRSSGACDGASLACLEVK
jgi:hypothetical protein